MSPRPLIRTLALTAALAMLAPGFGRAAPQQDPPDAPPADTSPLPADPLPADDTIVPPEPAEPDSDTIVIHVPAEPAPKPAAPRPRVAAPVRKSDAKVAAAVSPEVASQSSPRLATPATPATPVTPATAATTRKQTKPSRPKRPAPPRAPRPAVIRVPDRMPAVDTLAAGFSPASVDPFAPARSTLFYPALALGALLAMLVALVAAAPSLAFVWPRVFVPVARAQEQLLLAVACVVCLAITLAISWALTGPGA